MKRTKVSVEQRLDAYRELHELAVRGRHVRKDCWCALMSTTGEHLKGCPNAEVAR